MVIDYSFPDGWKYDIKNNEEDPLETDKSLSTYNVPWKCNMLLSHVIDEGEKRQ